MASMLPGDQSRLFRQRSESALHTKYGHEGAGHGPQNAGELLGLCIRKSALHRQKLDM